MLTGHTYKEERKQEFNLASLCRIYPLGSAYTTTQGYLKLNFRGIIKSNLDKILQ